MYYQELWCRIKLLFFLNCRQFSADYEPIMLLKTLIVNLHSVVYYKCTYEALISQQNSNYNRFFLYFVILEQIILATFQ